MPVIQRNIRSDHHAAVVYASCTSSTGSAGKVQRRKNPVSFKKTMRSIGRPCVAISADDLAPIIDGSWKRAAWCSARDVERRIAAAGIQKSMHAGAVRICSDHLASIVYRGRKRCRAGIGHGCAGYCEPLQQDYIRCVTVIAENTGVGPGANELPFVVNAGHNESVATMRRQLLYNAFHINDADVKERLLSALLTPLKLAPATTVVASLENINPP